MDLQKLAREIGLFETAANLAKVSSSDDVVSRAGAALPLPGADIEDRISLSAQWLLSFNKRTYLFLMPEIALIEEMSRRTDRNIEAVIAVPCDLDTEAKVRLRNNLPRGITVEILEEPYFPDPFYPKDAMIVISGYSGSDRAMVLPETYRLIEHYGSFRGKKVFIPYQELNSAADRYDGWLEIRQDRLSMKWSYNA